MKNTFFSKKYWFVDVRSRLFKRKQIMISISFFILFKVVSSSLSFILEFFHYFFPFMWYTTLLWAINFCSSEIPIDWRRKFFFCIFCIRHTLSFAPKLIHISMWNVSLIIIIIVYLLIIFRIMFFIEFLFDTFYMR